MSSADLFVHVLSDEHTTKEFVAEVASKIGVDTDPYKDYCPNHLTSIGWGLNYESLRMAYDEGRWEEGCVVYALSCFFDEDWRERESVEEFGDRAAAEEFADWLIGPNDQCPLIVVDEETTEEVHFPALVTAIRKHQLEEGQSRLRVFTHTGSDPRTLREVVDLPVTIRKIEA